MNCNFIRCAVAELLGALMAASQAGEVNNINSKAKIGGQAGKLKIFSLLIRNTNQLLTFSIT